MAKPQSFEAFEAEQEARRVTVEAAGWRGDTARVLMLRGNTPEAFAQSMIEANNLKQIANFARGQLTEAGIDVDLAVERSIIHALPLAECRAIIVQRLAEHDEATHTDTSQPASMQAAVGDVYAQRKAEAKQHGRR